MEKRRRSYKPHSETKIVLRGHPAVSVWCPSEQNGQCSWFIPYCASTLLLMERDWWLGVSSKISRYLFLWQFLALTIVSTLATPLNVINGKILWHPADLGLHKRELSHFKRYKWDLKSKQQSDKRPNLFSATYWFEKRIATKCLTTSKASDLGRVVGGQTPGSRYRIMEG